MKIRIILIAIISSVLFNLNSSNIKLEKIGIINIEIIMDTVFSGKSKTMQSIVKEKEELQLNLKKLEENIMILKEASLKEKDEAKKLAIEKKIQEISKQYSDYYQLRTYQIEQKVKDIKGPILKEIYSVVKTISAQEGYSLIIEGKAEGVFFYSVDSDITQKVIDYFNENFSE